MDLARAACFCHKWPDVSRNHKENLQPVRHLDGRKDTWKRNLGFQLLSYIMHYYAILLMENDGNIETSAAFFHRDERQHLGLGYNTWIHRKPSGKPQFATQPDVSGIAGFPAILKVLASPAGLWHNFGSDSPPSHCQFHVSGSRSRGTSAHRSR